MLIDSVRAFVEQALGRFDISADRSWDHQASAVLRLRDARGIHWYLKVHRESERYANELATYQKWVPALSERAPQLHAFDNALQAIILSEIPGTSALEPSADPIGAQPAMQYQAGSLLRRFHDAGDFPVRTDFAAEKLAEFDGYHPAELLPREEADFVRSELRMLESAPPPRQVPCHFDYNLRNWIVHDSRLHVLDFELTRPDVWISDLTRLAMGPWRGNPEQQEAFLDGYGRVLDDADQAILRSCCALNTVFLIAHAHDCRRTEFEAFNRRNLRQLMLERDRPRKAPNTA